MTRISVKINSRRILLEELKTDFLSVSNQNLSYHTYNYYLYSVLYAYHAVWSYFYRMFAKYQKTTKVSLGVKA